MIRAIAFSLALTAMSPFAFAAPAYAQEATAQAPEQSAEQTAEQAPDQTAAEAAAQAADTARMNASAKVVQRALDAWRARNFEGWIANYADDVVITAPGMMIVGRTELRVIYRSLFDERVPAPDILASGWTGERVYVRQQEYLDKDTPLAITYSEYEVRGGKITAVYGAFD